MLGMPVVLQASKIVKFRIVGCSDVGYFDKKVVVLLKIAMRGGYSNL